MAKTAKVLFLIISIGLLIFLASVGMEKDTKRILGMRVISQEEFSQIASGRSLRQGSTLISYEGEALSPVEELEACLISQSMDVAHWQGQLRAENGLQLCVLDPQMDKRSIIAQGAALQIAAYSADSYELHRLVVSGLPVIYVDGETAAQDVCADIRTYEEAQAAKMQNASGRVLVMDNDAMGRKSLVSLSSYDCAYRLRGGSSAIEDKKPWKLNLYDQRGDAEKVSLLGMKVDNDWILNPMACDRAEMREKIGFDLWNEMTPQGRQELRYCELVFGGRYQGIYCLQESVDYRTYENLASDSLLFSVKKWENESGGLVFREDAVERLYSQEMRVDEFSVDKCQEDQMGLAVEMLRVIKAGLLQEPYESKLTIAFDEETAANYALLIDMVYATDNRYKNQKFALRLVAQNQYVIEKTAWDLDWSMVNPDTQADADVTRHLEDTFFYGDKAAIAEQMKEKYWTYRQTFFNVQELEKRIDQYADLLQSSGAIARESHAWQQPDFDESCGQIKAFFKARIDALDAYYGG